MRAFAGAVRSRAGRAKLSDQTLRHHARDRRGEQIAFQPDVDQARDRGNRAVGVQGREHQMAGQRRLDGDARGFEVADFADHDDVGVLAQDRAQRHRKVETDLRLDLDLVDPGELVLDRILDREQLQFGPIEILQAV